MSTLALSRIHFPVTNLGYGRRVGVWLQGCSVHCRGCISVDTWAVRPGHIVALDSVVAQIATFLSESDGLTVSGGEPTDQPEALATLLTEVRALTCDRDDWDVLVYSGQSLAGARQLVPQLDSLADAIVSEPFDASLTAGDLALRGSSNQRVTPLTDLGRCRYPTSQIDEVYGMQRQSIGVCVDDDNIWLVGIPKPGDLPRLEEGLADAGVELAGRSWLS